ncbi:MAG: hemerythrin domain-containing protein [Thermoflavifilum sp.]|nr:hemerythrin domain-containing protein [Thermoflavifilum sp.]
MKKQWVINRDEALGSLGKDHHYDLMFCWRIKQGLKKQINPERLLQYVKYFWFTHLREHLSEEENLLFGRVKDELCLQAYREHNEIRRQLRKIFYRDHQRVAAYQTLIDLLMGHIHFEEDVLFPHLEQALPHHFLVEVSKPIAALHEQAMQDDYADVFWGSSS